MSFGGTFDIIWSKQSGGGGDTSAPVVQSIVVNAVGDVVVTCNESLNESLGAATDFTLDAPSGVTFDIIVVAGNTITLGPSRPIYEGEVVTLDYTPGGIEDLAGNDLEAISNYAVTNNSEVVAPDTTAPTVDSIVANAVGDVVVTCAEDLNESLGAATDFTLDAPTGVTFDTITIDGPTITLGPSRPIYEDEVVTLDYTPGDIEDLAGNPLGVISNYNVTNNSEVPAPASPEVVSIVADSAGTSTDVTFGENMDQTSTPAGGDLSFSGTPVTIASAAWQSATVLRLTHATHRLMGSLFSTPTLNYTPGVNPIRGLVGNNLDAFNGEAVTNNSTQEPMMSTETLYASGNWTAPADLYGTTCFVESWAPGEGGQTATKAGDTGYYCAVTDTIAASGVYAYTIGAIGSAGGGNGGDNTWRTNILVAPGGGSTTTAIGDVIRAGSAGQSAAGAATGGGSPGSSSAGTSGASGGAAGEPNGAPGISSNIASRGPGTGGASTGSQQRAGGVGWKRVVCLRHPPLTGPYVVSLAEYRDTAGTTSRSLPAPAGTHVAGDYGVVLSGLPGATVPSSLQATTVLNTANGTAVNATMFLRAMTGTDTITITSSNVSGAFRYYRIRGANGTASANGATGTTSAPNPGTHNPTGGANILRLVFQCCAVEAQSNNANTIGGQPADYPGINTPQRSNSNTSAGLVTGTRREQAMSYTPGAFTNSIENWAAICGSME